jgi:hypothetical protein
MKMICKFATKALWFMEDIAFLNTSDVSVASINRITAFSILKIRKPLAICSKQSDEAKWTLISS